MVSFGEGVPTKVKLFPLLLIKVNVPYLINCLKNLKTNTYIPLIGELKITYF
jgi:hypothetical protein